MNHSSQNVSTVAAPVLKASAPTGQPDPLFSPQKSSLALNIHAQQALISCKGWVRFLSVMGFISFALVIIAFIAGLVAHVEEGITSGIGLIQMVVFAVMSVVLFILSFRLSKFAGSITRMQLVGQPVDFEAAMVEQMKFWALFGVLTIMWMIIALISVISSRV